jgi:hypothetical protein
MSAIPATQRKLGHAHEKFRLLQASARVIPLNHEECHRLLGDFLSAAYSVEDVLKDDIAVTHGKRYANRWVDRWWSKPRPRQALHTFMREQRNDELHHQGAAINTEPQEISAEDYLQRTEWTRSGGGNGRSFFGDRSAGGYPPA